MTTIFVPGVGPQPHILPSRLSKKAAVKALKNSIIRFMDSAEVFLGSSPASDDGVDETPETVSEEGSAGHHTTPPRFGIIGEASLGKTDVILDALRPSIWQARRVLYLAPSIELGDELKERAKAKGIKEVHVIRGRSQDNPETPGQTMCLKADIAVTIASLGYNITQTLCKDKAGNECEFAASCAYLAQMQTLKKGGMLLIGAHAYLPIAMDLLRENKIDLVIIDESFWQSMIRQATVPIDRLLTVRYPDSNHRTFKRQEGESADDAADRFMEDRYEFEQIQGKASRAIRAAQDESRQVTLEDFRSENLSSGDCKFAAGMEYTRIGSAEINPGMSGIQQRALLEKAVSREAFSLGRFWKCVGAELETSRTKLLQSVRLEIGRLNRAGDLENAIVMDFSADARFQQTPVLVIDADADPVILDRFYPGIETETIAAEWSNVRVRQVHDRTGSKAAFMNPANRDRVRHIAEDLFWQMRDRITDPSMRPLLVVQKQMEDAWKEEGRNYNYDGADLVPQAAFSVAHFGNTRGKDGWKDTVAAIIVGRIEPSPQELTRLARALFFKSEEEIVSIVPDDRGQIVLPRRDVVMTAKDGGSVTVSVSYHPDDRADRILRQIREGEISQAIARVRPVHRSEDAPCEVLVLTNVPLRIMPDEFAAWTEIVPDRIRFMEMRGFVPDLSSDVADAYPDLFASPAAVRQAASRAGKRDDLYKDSYYGGCHTYDGMTRIEYRREGNRRSRMAWARVGDDETPSAVAARLRVALPDIYGVIILHPLPSPDECASAASDASDDMAMYIEEQEEAGHDIWWRPPLRPATVAETPFRLLYATRPEPGLELVT